MAAATGTTRSSGASASRGHEQKVSENTKQMREICCEERRGMRGCCDRKLGGPLEKDKETKKDVVYATPGGRRCHVYEDCRAVTRAKVQVGERCKSCTRQAVEEATEILERSSGSNKAELEAEMAQTGRQSKENAEPNCNDLRT